MMRALDLFSAAAGGWSLGLHRAGFVTVAACEIVEWRRILYSENFPHVRLYDDVRTLTAARLVSDLGFLPDIIVGSPPCQDISSANTKGKGIEGERSSLYLEAVRLVGDCRPRWFAFENSNNLRTRAANPRSHRPRHPAHRSCARHGARHAPVWRSRRRGNAMTARRLTILSMLAGTALIVLPAFARPDIHFIWNASASVPVGLYRIVPADRIEVTDLAVVMPPDELAGFLDERGYLPRGVPLIKRVLALGGATVCRSGSAVIAYGATYAEARARDTRGRPLPIWQGCRRLGDGEAFFMNWDSPDSFDGRYFGPLPLSTVVGRAIPFWTDEDGAGLFEWRAPTH